MCIAVYVHVYITQIYTKHYGLDTHVSQNTHAHAHPNTVYVVAVVMLLALGFLILAPRHISSAEVALILLGETVLSPLWVYLGVGEAPTVWTLGGGALLIATLFMHELAALREARRETKTAAKAITTATDEVAVIVK